MLHLTMNNTPNHVRRERRRPQISCTECRRRKQKCNKKSDQPCANCMRRYPPVECYVQESEEPRMTNWRKRAKKRTANESSSSYSNGPHLANAESSGFPPIPLSRILHPANHLIPRHEVSNIKRLPRHFTKREAGYVVEEDTEDDDLTPTQRALKFVEPRFKNVVQRELYSKECPRTLGGIVSMLNSFNDMPVKTSLRNAELFHFFHNYVQPRLCSIDGGSIPAVFAKEILPWQMQSPLMPNVAILMAAATQSNLRQSDIEGDPETLTIKSRVLSLVNQFIQRDFCMVSNQAMRVVIHLVVIEFFWGNAKSMWPHMYGIKQMLDLVGGLYGMNDPLNTHVLIVTDYELACAFETNLIFQSTESALATELPILETYPAKYRCPLIAYSVSFQDCREALCLHASAAEILDDVRFLTLEITSCFPSVNLSIEPILASKIQSTADWLYKRLEVLPELDVDKYSEMEDVIFDTIRISALVYSSAIKTPTPMSLSFPETLKQRMQRNISHVGLENWKAIPGIFLWILLVATPSSPEDFQGRFLRKQMACTGMALGMEDFFRGTAYLRAFWVVQRWIESESAKTVDAESDA